MRALQRKAHSPGAQAVARTARLPAQTHEFRSTISRIVPKNLEDGPTPRRQPRPASACVAPWPERPVSHRPPARPAGRDQARARRDRRRGPPGRDRRLDRDIAGIPHRRHQHLPAGLERLRGDDGARQRRGPPDAAGRHARLGAPGSRSSTSGSAPRRLHDPARSVRLGAATSAAATSPTGSRAQTPDAWHPDDELFVPMRHTDGHMLGIMSVGEPCARPAPLRRVSSRCSWRSPTMPPWPSQSAQEAAAAALHRIALRQLLQVSSRLTETLVGRGDPPGRRATASRRARVPEGVRSTSPTRVTGSSRPARRPAGRSTTGARTRR